MGDTRRMLQRHWTGPGLGRLCPASPPGSWMAAWDTSICRATFYCNLNSLHSGGQLGVVLSIWRRPTPADHVVLCTSCDV